MISPVLVNAKTHTNSVSKDVALSGGVSLNSIAKVDKNYLNKYMVINKNSTISQVLSGRESVSYYTRDNSPTSFNGGSYVFSIKGGTDSDLDFSILYKKYLKIVSKEYDLRLDIDKVYNVNNGVIYVS